MQAETIFLGILVICAIVVLAVVLYGMYQENQYRKEIFKQFGHTNKDVLLDNPIRQVRDGDDAFEPTDKAHKSSFLSSLTKKNNLKKNSESTLFSEFNDTEEELSNQNIYEAADDEGHTEGHEGIDSYQQFLMQQTDESADLEEHHDSTEDIDEAQNVNGKASILDKISKIFPQKIKRTNESVALTELEQLDLPWFNKCFDYMAYITLDEPKELNVLPRLSSKHRFRIAACNLDEQFQLAEPIPGLKYQAYVIGLQAISRSGLASKNELTLFGKNIQDFAKSVGGEYWLTDIDEFYEIARPMDELCARVDQIIGLHLVSRDSVDGIDLRAALERNKFVLSHDGAFYYPNTEEILFKIVNIDETPFTASLLASQSFKGFSILFDITQAPPGEKVFDEFMGLAVKLANELGLDLVDDQLGELSTEWLRNIGRYVLDRQKEMEEVGIIPGEDLAKRLFA